MSTFPDPTETVHDHFTREFRVLGPFEPWAQRSVRDAVSDRLFLWLALRLHAMTPTVLRAVVEYPGALEDLAEMLDPEVSPATWDSPLAKAPAFAVVHGPAITARHGAKVLAERLNEAETSVVLAADFEKVLAEVADALRERGHVVRLVLDVAHAAGFAMVMRGLETDILRSEERAAEGTS